MMNVAKFVFALICLAGVLSAKTLAIPMKGSSPVTRKTIHYRCDASGRAVGLPSGPFAVEYINGGGNALAVLPIASDLLVFANVISGSGARYAARQFVWWDAGNRGVSLRWPTENGERQSNCSVVTP